MNFVLLVLILMAVLCVFRIIIGPTIWDRLLVLNLLTSKLILMIIVIATIKAESFILDIALVYSLLGFIGVTFIAISVQRRSRV